MLSSGRVTELFACKYGFDLVVREVCGTNEKNLDKKYKTCYT